MTTTTTPVTIITVDTRERSLFAELARTEVADADLRVAALDVGDVTISVSYDDEEESRKKTIIIERKTLSDLCASIKDGRYREQKARMLGVIRSSSTKTRLTYVIEGTASFGNGLRDAAQSSGLGASALQTCVVKTLYRDGIDVVFTRDVADTAEFVRAAARVWSSCSSSDAASAPCCSEALLRQQAASKPRRADNLDPRTCYLAQLCQVPGISCTIANTIAERWPGMQDLFSQLSPLSEAERVSMLAACPRLGPKSARRIVSFLFPSAV